MLKNRLFPVLSLLMAVALILGACAPAAATEAPAATEPPPPEPTAVPPTELPLGSTEKPIIMALAPSANTTELIAGGEAIAAKLTELTGYTIEVTVPTNYAALIEAMVSGNAQIGWLPTVRNMSSPSTFYTGGTEKASFYYRKKITIDHTKVSADLTNFPVLFSQPADLDLTAAQPEGQDFVFVRYDDNLTTLAYEIEYFNDATGQLIAWVRVPSIDNGTVLYVHYSDSAVGATTENRPGVWNSGYKGVWHLRGTPAGVAGEMKDSTSNANNGTGEVGPASFPTQTAGQIDGSLAFDGTLDRDVLVADNASLRLATNITVSGWARTTSIDAQPRLIVAKQLQVFTVYMSVCRKELFLFLRST